MPNLAYSLESVFAKPATADRMEFESSRPSTGCLTVVEVMVMNRPHPFFFIRGSVSRAKYTVLRSKRSTADRQSSGRVSTKSLDGGPPELVTQMSIFPKRLSVEEKNAVSSDSFVTSMVL